MSWLSKTALLFAKRLPWKMFTVSSDEVTFVRLNLSNRLINFFSFCLTVAKELSQGSAFVKMALATHQLTFVWWLLWDKYTLYFALINRLCRTLANSQQQKLTFEAFVWSILSNFRVVCLTSIDNRWTDFLRLLSNFKTLWNSCLCFCQAKLCLIISFSVKYLKTENLKV